MDSYGDGNVYRGMVCKDSEIKTIEINRYNADVKMCRASMVKILCRGDYRYNVICDCPRSDTACLKDHSGDYYPAESVERLMEAAETAEVLLRKQLYHQIADKLKAALEPFNK